MAEIRTHAVAQAILARRSWRIYTEAPMAPEVLDGLRRVASAAPSVRGRGAARIEWVHEPAAVASLTRVATGGLIGKGNLWLRSAPPAVYAVLVGDAERGLRHEDRHLYNVDAAIAGELVALAAASVGIGSCWMAAVDMRGIASHLELAAHERLPAVIALGEPGRKRKGALLAAGWDRVARAMVSSRRKPMAKICHLDRFASGRSLESPKLDTLTGDDRPLTEVIESAQPSERFAGDTPGDEQLALILEAMRLAPSAENAQTWRFVVLRGGEQTAAALAAAGLDVPLDGAPGALVVVTSAPFVIKNPNREQPFPLIDHPIALTHGVLAAEALGLHWNLAFLFDHERVRAHVGAPADHPVTAMLALDGAGERAGPEANEWVQVRRQDSFSG